MNLKPKNNLNLEEYEPKIGFDSDLYKKLQCYEIKKRAEKFNDKIYLEVGGKLLDDSHAERVLPGYRSNLKFECLKDILPSSEIILCIRSTDIEKKICQNTHRYYDDQLFLEHDLYKKHGFSILGVVISLFKQTDKVKKFIKRCQLKKLPVFKHYKIEDYPYNIKNILSKNGLEKNDYILTNKKVIIVTGPGPNSGKFSTCISQIYHEYKNNKKLVAYGKFETFPVWNLPLSHPLNIAYEAATLDINDKNIIDSYFINKTGKYSTSYNRDYYLFPLIKKILENIFGSSPYDSPTEMGINCISNAIINNDCVINSSLNEIIRRYQFALIDASLCKIRSLTILKRIKNILKKFKINPNIRIVNNMVSSTPQSSIQKTFCFIQLHNGTIISGKNSPLLSAVSACVLNSLKHILKIPKDSNLLSEIVLNKVISFKQNLKNKTNEVSNLSLDEVLISLNVSSIYSDLSKQSSSHFHLLNSCEAHITSPPSSNDIIGLKKLGINYTYNY